MDRLDRKNLPSEAGSLNEAGTIAGNWRWRRLTRNELDIQKPCSAGGSEIRPYRIRVVRWVGRAASPRRPLSRWELSSACHAVLGGPLGDPPLPNPCCAM